MTAIPLSPVGCGETAPLAENGRPYAFGLIASEIGAAFCTVGALAPLLVEPLGLSAPTERPPRARLRL